MDTYAFSAALEVTVASLQSGGLGASLRPLLCSATLAEQVVVRGVHLKEHSRCTHRKCHWDSVKRKGTIRSKIGADATLNTIQSPSPWQNWDALAVARLSDQALCLLVH